MQKMMKVKMFLIVCVMVLLSGIASATIVVDGATTALPWDSSLNIIVGNAGAGSVAVDGGTTVASSYAEIGYKTNGHGTATLSGSGTKWTAARFRVGYGTATATNNWGRMSISGGAVAESTTYTTLGASYSGTVGYVDVDGSGSQLIVGTTLRIGDVGKGALAITNGGLVQAVDSTSGVGYSNSSGTAGSQIVVQDSGSKLVLSGDFYVSRYGYECILRIADSGLVKIGGVLHMNDGGTPNNGIIRMSTGGQLALYGNGSTDIAAFLGLTDTPDDNYIKYWNGSSWADIASAVANVDYTLEYVTSGDLSGYTVLTVTTLTPACEYNITGDFNNDCTVNFADFAEMAASWMLDCAYPGVDPECIQ